MNTETECVRVGVLPVETWTPHPDGGVFRYVDISSVDREAKTVEGVVELPVEKAPSRARQLLRAEDVLVSTVRPNLNAVAIVPPELDGAVGSTGFTVLRANRRRLLSRYLFHWVRTSMFVSEMVRKATGANYPAISDRIVLDSHMPMPPVAEQGRVADILDKADAICRKRKQAIALTEDLLRSAFLDMVGDPVTNPKGWPVQPLADLASVSGGLQVTRARAGNPIALPYLRVANVYRDRLDLSEVKEIRLTSAERERALLQSGDVLVVEGHGNADELGRAAVWHGEIRECTHQNHLIRVRGDQRLVRPTFVSAFLNSSSGRAQMLRMGKTTSGLNTISTNNVRSVSVVVPPLELQERFENFVNHARSLATRMRSHRHDEDLFQSLVTVAFSERRPASVSPC